MKSVLTISDAICEALSNAGGHGNGMGKDERRCMRDLLSGRVGVEAFQACCVEADLSSGCLCCAERYGMAQVAYGWVQGCIGFCQHSGNIEVLVKEVKKYLHGLICIDFSTMSSLDELKELLRRNLGGGMRGVLELCDLSYLQVREMLRELMTLVEGIIDGLFAAARKEDELEDDVGQLWQADYKARLAKAADARRDSVKASARRMLARKTPEETLQFLFDEWHSTADISNKYIARNEYGQLAADDMAEYIASTTQDNDALEAYFRYMANKTVLDELKTEFGCEDLMFYKTIYIPMDKDRERPEGATIVEAGATLNQTTIYGDQHNYPNATTVNNYHGPEKNQEAELIDTKPLMKYVFEDTTRNKFAVGLGTCTSAPEVAALIRQMIDSHVLNIIDVKSKAFREAIIPYLGYTTSENTLRVSVGASL